MPFSLSSLDDVAEAEEGGQGPVKPKPFSLSSLDQDQGQGPKPFSLSSLDDGPAPTVEGKILAMPGLTDAEKLEHVRTIHRNRFAQAQAGNEPEEPGAISNFARNAAMGAVEAGTSSMRFIQRVAGSMPPLGRTHAQPNPDAIEREAGQFYRPGGGVSGTLGQLAGFAPATLIPGVGEAALMPMAERTAQYGGQKAAEMSLPPDVRALAEQDPERISGREAATNAAMLALPLGLHLGGRAAMAGLDRLADVSPGMTEAGAKGVGAAMRGENTIDLRLAERGRLDEMQKHLDQRFANAPLEPTTPAAGADRGGTPGLAGVGADAGAGGAAGGTGAAGEQVAGDPALGRPGYAPQDPQELSREAQPGDAEQEPERVDLFGNAVAPTAEQGSLFGPSVGAAKAETPGAISPEEMSARRDELGAPKQPPIVGPGELFANPVGPVVRGAARGVQAAAGWARALPPIASIGDAWNRTFDPAARSVEAGETAGTMRTRLGEMAGTYERASTAMRDASAPTRGRKVLNALDLARPFDNASDAERLDFEDRMEHGQQQATPQLTAMAKAIRSSFDGVRDQIRQLGVGALDDFIENWFPHLWQDPQAATNAFAQTYGKRPMEGSKAFLKQRTVPTVKDGIARGLVPVTTNPVELSLLKLREMQRFLMAQQTMADLKTKGLLQLVPNGARAPQGFVRLNDKVARVPGQGEYWAPEPVARIMNNYLSPGLRGNGIFDAIHGAGKAINMAQLGLSAFHLGFTSLDAMTSRVALALEQFSHGKPLTAAGTMASSVAAPVSNIMSGASIRRAYLRPGEQGSAIGAALQTPVSDAMRGNWRTPQGLAKDAQVIGDWVERAGGRVKMDSFYHLSSVEKAVDALRQGQVAWGQGDLRQVAKQSGRFALNTIPGALQMAAKPIMEWVVPAQKLGVFGDLAREAMDQLPSTATRAQEDAVLQKVWNSVDNRMGQLVYDNLFWNKTFKDLSMAGVRSVGWNLGTVRELGGGVGDIARQGTRLAAGQDASLTHRAAYVLALPITVGMMGAVINYLSTGEGPQESKDYFFPRTGTSDEDGNENRVQLPSYMKDVFGFGANPWGTVKHKMSPAIAMIGEMLDNQNYYGDQIRNPRDPFVERRLQEARYVAQALQPFSMQNAGEGAKRGDTSLLGRYGSSIGITPAPLRQTRSDAQNMMSDYLAERRVTGATPEDAEARLDRHNLLVDMRGGGTGDLADALDKALEHGAVTPAQFGKLLKRAGTTPMREQFGRLTTQQAMNVFQEADQPQRAQFLDLLSKKLTNAARTGGFAP